MVEGGNHVTLPQDTPNERVKRELCPHVTHHDTRRWSAGTIAERTRNGSKNRALHHEAPRPIESSFSSHKDSTSYGDLHEYLVEQPCSLVVVSAFVNESVQAPLNSIVRRPLGSKLDESARTYMCKMSMFFHIRRFKRISL